MIRRVICVIGLVALWGSALRAEEPETQTMADEHHETASRLVLRLAEGINAAVTSMFQSKDQQESELVRHFYGDRVSAYHVEGSHIRVTPRVLWSERSGEKYKMDFSARLRLAEVNKRLRFFADSYDTEHDTIDDIYSERYRKKLDRERSEGATAGLVYLLSDRVSRRISLSGGMRFRPQPSPRLRLSARFRTDWGAWEPSFTQSVFWDAEDGFGERSQVEMMRPIGHSQIFKASATAVWSEISHGVDWGQYTTYQYHLSPHRSTTLRVGARGYTHPSTIVDQYLARVSYRQRLYRDWLYWTAETGMDFFREDDFERSVVAMLKVDVWFGSY